MEAAESAGIVPLPTEITYACLNLTDHTLSDNNLASACPLDTGHDTAPSPFDLGALDGLPLELLQTILILIDLRTLMAARQVNRRALQIVDSIPQFKAIVTHAPNALRGILAIGTGPWITGDALFRALCTSQCDLCGDHGSYIYLLTCWRVCFLCLSESTAFLPLSFRAAARKFGLDHGVLKSLPSMKSIPRVYSPNKRKCSRRVRLVDAESTRQASLRIQDRSMVTGPDESDLRSQMVHRDRHNRGRRAVVGTDQVRHSLALPERETFDEQSGNPLRFMAIVQSPVLDCTGRRAIEAFFCAGCKDSYVMRPQHYRRQYTASTFDAHIRECGAIVDGPRGKKHAS